MPDTENRGDLFELLQAELSSRGVVISPAAPSHAITNWSIARDEYGFTIAFPIDELEIVGDWIERCLGVPKFQADDTRIYRNDDTGVTVMVATANDSAQLILLHWKDPVVRTKIAARQTAAIRETISDALKEAYNSFQEAIDAVGADEQDARLTEAIIKTEEVRAVLDDLISRGRKEE